MSATVPTGLIAYRGNAGEGLSIQFKIGDLEFAVVAKTHSDLDRVTSMIGQQCVSPLPCMRVVVIDRYHCDPIQIRPAQVCHFQPRN